MSEIYILLSGPSGIGDLILMSTFWIGLLAILIYSAIQAIRHKKKRARNIWVIFKDLTDSLEQRNQVSIAAEFREAKLLVAGLTDGWYELLKKFKEVEVRNSEKLIEIEKAFTTEFITTIAKSLQSKK